MSVARDEARVKAVTKALAARELKREITFDPAYDKRHADPQKNYGIHGVTMQWVLSGELGAVTLTIFTGWHLPKVVKEFDHVPASKGAGKPMAADIGYHSPKPTYDGQKPMGKCHILEGECYYDGSSLNAERYLELLISKGGGAVWEEMEKYYIRTFGELR